MESAALSCTHERKGEYVCWLHELGTYMHPAYFRNRTRCSCRGTTGYASRKFIRIPRSRYFRILSHAGDMNLNLSTLSTHFPRVAGLIREADRLSPQPGPAQILRVKAQPVRFRSRYVAHYSADYQVKLRQRARTAADHFTAVSRPFCFNCFYSLGQLNSQLHFHLRGHVFQIGSRFISIFLGILETLAQERHFSRRGQDARRRYDSLLQASGI